MALLTSRKTPSGAAGPLWEEAPSRWRKMAAQHLHLSDNPYTFADIASRTYALRPAL